MHIRHNGLGRWIGLFLLLVMGTANAAENKLVGLVFGDYYYIASGAKKKQNGFEIRRIYLTYDVKWNEAFSGRVRIEANDAGFGSGQKIEPYVKNAYLRYRKDGRALFMGLSGTPAFAISEGVWGYRTIEKMMMDLNKVVATTDLGVTFQGRLDQKGRVNVHMMLANGSGQNSENDNNKKIYGLMHVKPGAFEATVYADWENRTGDTDRITAAGFLGRSGKRFHGGAEGFVQVRKNLAGNVQVRGLSIFGAGSVGAHKAFGRVDFFDPNHKAGQDRTYLVMGGADITLAEGLHVMPNVLSTIYQDSRVDAQVMPRVTVFMEF